MKYLQRVSKSFRNRAPEAAFWEAWVGSVLSRNGLYVLHYPFNIDGQDHGESWDLDIATGMPVPGIQHVVTSVEVKSLSKTFTTARDFPQKEVIVCSQNNHIRKWPSRDYTMRDFLLVSKETGAIVWIPTMTQLTMGVEVEDSKRGELYKVVTCRQVSLRNLGDFIEYIKER